MNVNVANKYVLTQRLGYFSSSSTKSFEVQAVKKFINILFFLSLCSPSMAEQPLPNDIKPLIGEVTLRLLPKHVSRCTTKKHETKPGEFFGTRITDFGSIEVFKESTGKIKYQINIGDAMNYFRIIADVKQDGTRFEVNEPEIQTNIKVPEKDQPKVEAVKQMLVRLPKVGAFGIGLPLRQGAVAPSGDACQILPGASGTEKRSGGYTVLGTTTVSGRESIILGGEETVSCILPGTLMNLRVKGWFAIDLQSGLTSGSSTWSKANIDGIPGEITTSEDKECVVSGEVSTADKSRTPDLENTANPNSSERRLRELQLLLNKGLISKEQYELRSTEILKSI